MRNRNFSALFWAGVASVAGSVIAGLCFVWLIFQNTGSSWDIALYGVAGLAAGVVFSLVAGTFVDRYDKRRLMIVSDLGRAGLLATLLASSALFGFQLSVVIVSVFAIAALTTVFLPAENTVIPLLVGEESVSDANGLVGASRSLAVLGASSVGGALIVTVGPYVGLGFNIVTFLSSAAMLSLIRLPPAARTAPGPPADRSVRAFVRETAEGVAWLRSNAGFLELTLSATFFNCFSTILQTFLVFFAVLALHGSAFTFALLLGLNVAGGGVGVLLVGRFHAVRFAGLAWTVPYGAVSGALLVAMAAYPNVFGAAAVLFALGICSGFAGNAWLSAAQTLVPREVQGRYFGIDSLGSNAVTPVAQVVGGFLVAAMGVVPTYEIAGAAWLLSGLVFLVPRALRELGYREPPPGGPEGRDGPPAPSPRP